MTRKLAALFDLDGVIIDTEGTYSNFWHSMGLKYGVPHTDFAERIKGTTLQNILTTYFSPEKQPEVMADLLKFEDDMQYPIFPGAMQLLASLRAQGIPSAIVTSSGPKKMKRLWEQHPDLRACFDAVITDAEVTRSKPDPQGYLLAAETLGADPKDCYVFEDSINGLKAGRVSGARVIALSTTNPASALAGLCDLIIPSLESFSLTLAE